MSALQAYLDPHGTAGLKLEYASALATNHTEEHQEAHSDVLGLHGSSEYQDVTGHVRHIPEDIAADIESGSTSFVATMQVALHSVTRAQGALQVCPGTHRDFVRAEVEVPALARSTPADYRELRRVVCKKPVVITSSAGDVTIYDARIIHWGGSNMATSQRRVLSYSFSHKWFVDLGRQLSEEEEVEREKHRTAFELSRLSGEGPSGDTCS